MDVFFERVAIVGVGLIGGCVARDLRRLGLARRLVGADAHAPSLARAVQLGLVDEAAADVVSAARGADLVVLAAPPEACATLALALGPGLAPGAVLTDVASTKAPLVHALAGRLPRGHGVVPSHPVAGTERSGPEAALDGLFAGRWAIVTPLDGGAPEAVTRVRALWEALGARVAVMDAARHDRLMAAVSHLPHAVAFALCAAVAGLDAADPGAPGALELAAGGLRDYTRVAGSEPALWAEILTLNAAAMAPALAAMSAELAALADATAAGDRAALRAHFASARRVRERLLESGAVPPPTTATAASSATTATAATATATPDAPRTPAGPPAPATGETAP